MIYRRILYLPLLVLATFHALSCGRLNREQELSASDNDSVNDLKPQSAVLFFVGDAMQHQGQVNRALKIGQTHYDFSDCFSNIRPLTQQADYAVVNLEVPLGGGRGGYTGYPCFSAPDSYAVALKEAGFDLFLTSNNHTLDRLDYGLRRTINVLDSMQVDHIGTYHDKQQRDSLIPFIRNINGFEVAFLNYTYGTNGLNATDGAEVCLIDNETMKNEIGLAKKYGAEIIVVCIHWGEEYCLVENKRQRETANFLLEQGVDMIIGGHPHVVEPMLLEANPATGKPSLTVYSLGNFISNQLKPDSRGGAAVTCKLERDSSGVAYLSEANYSLLFTQRPSNPSENFKVIISDMTDSLPINQKQEWQKFEKNARTLFEKHNVNVKELVY